MKKIKNKLEYTGKEQDLLKQEKSDIKEGIESLKEKND